MSDPALEVQVVRRVHAGLTVDATLKLDSGCGILFGPSGSGKSTVLRLIAGLARPDSGSLRLAGTTLFDSARRIDLPLRARRIGLIYQDDRLFPHLSVAGNVRFGLNGWPRAEAERRLAEVAALCGVGALLDRRPETLSGGERQRVGLARALAPRPRLLLCDEPVSALDLEGRQALIARLGAVGRAEGLPILYVTHAPAEALALGTQLFRLAQGRVIDQGAPLDVLATAHGGPVADWSGVANLLAGTVERHAPAEGETWVRLAGGPTLVVPLLGRPPGAPLTIAVRADDILLAVAPVAGLSARNVLPGRVVRVLTRGAEAEVLIQAGETVWIASVVAGAVASLGLHPGAELHMIVKARGCRVLPEGS